MSSHNSNDDMEVIGPEDLEDSPPPSDEHLKQDSSITVRDLVKEDFTSTTDNFPEEAKNEDLIEVSTSDTSGDTEQIGEIVDVDVKNSSATTRDDDDDPPIEILQAPTPPIEILLAPTPPIEILKEPSPDNVPEQLDAVDKLESTQTSTPPIVVSPKLAAASPKPVEAAPKPVEAAPKPVEAAPKSVEAPTEPVQAVPEPIQAAPEPVQAAPEPVQAAPEPVQVVPEPVQVQAAPEPVPANPKPQVVATRPTVTTERPAATLEEVDDEEDDDDIDETLTERLIGLTEMFPDFVRNGSVNLVKGSWSLTQSCYSLGRAAAWVVFSSATILFMPVMIESERLQLQDQQKAQKNQILLGPGAAVSGGPSLGPPPI